MSLDSPVLTCPDLLLTERATSVVAVTERETRRSVTTDLEAARKLVSSRSDLSARIESLATASEHARGRLDNTLVDAAAVVAERADSRRRRTTPNPERFNEVPFRERWCDDDTIDTLPPKEDTSFYSPLTRPTTVRGSRHSS